MVKYIDCKSLEHMHHWMHEMYKEQKVRHTASLKESFKKRWQNFGTLFQNWGGGCFIAFEWNVSQGSDASKWPQWWMKGSSGALMITGWEEEESRVGFLQQFILSCTSCNQPDRRIFEYTCFLTASLSLPDAIWWCRMIASCNNLFSLALVALVERTQQHLPITKMHQLIAKQGKGRWRGYWIIQQVDLKITLKLNLSQLNTL